MKIVKTDIADRDNACTITRLGGKHDGLKFIRVKAELDDGSIIHVWVSNERKGYFKQVFVPWDFNHSKIIE